MDALIFTYKETTWEGNGFAYTEIWQGTNSKLIHLLSMRINLLRYKRAKMNYNSLHKNRFEDICHNTLRGKTK